MSLLDNYPVDIVFMWVDGKDKKHIEKISKYAEVKKTNKVGFRTRFDQVNEIEYAVKSVIKYAKFIRNIFIVTDNQIPKFIENKTALDYKNVFVIDHKEIFGKDIDYLPVFNNRPIETKLCNIPNLAEHFIYFNDDLFLLREAFLSDFFIDKKPVIRGGWVNFKENIYYKKIVNSSKNKKRSSHRKAQENSAKLLGYKKYFKFHHVPHPMRKSTIQDFYKKNRDIELMNIKHRFRNPGQYTLQGLANHIEIKNNTAILKKNYRLIFFRNYKKSFWWLKYKLIKLTKKEKYLFLNLQSLDQCSDEKLNFILNWLNKKYL